LFPIPMTDAIETSRLLLVPLGERHVLALSQAVNNFRIIQNTARIPWPYRLDDASAFWRFTVGRQGRSPCFCIFAKDQPDVLAGGISYEKNVTGSEAEIGYWVAEPCWGRGYGLEAARAAVSHAFRHHGIDRMVAGYRHGNEASRRILDRLGFRLVGHRASYSVGTGRTMPTARLELTRREWLRAGSA